MKRIGIILYCNILIISNIIGQNTALQKERTNNFDHYITLNQAVHSGIMKIQVIDSTKTNVTKQDYQIIFSKAKTDRPYESEFQYNILSLTDSVQYIYNHRTWYVINHKKKTYTVENESSWSKSSCIIPYFWPDILLNLMCSYYLHQQNPLTDNQEILLAQKEGTAFTLKTRSGYPIKKNTVFFTKTYVWNTTGNGLLSKCRQQIMESGKNGKTKVVSNYESHLTDVSFNTGQYSDTSWFEGNRYINANYRKTKM